MTSPVSLSCPPSFFLLSFHSSFSSSFFFFSFITCFNINSSLNMRESLDSFVGLGMWGRRMVGKGRSLFWPPSPPMVGERPNRPVTYWSKVEENSCWQAGCSASESAWASSQEVWKVNTSCSNRSHGAGPGFGTEQMENHCVVGPQPWE